MSPSDDRGSDVKPGVAVPFGMISAALREYAVITLDVNGVVTGWNPGAARNTGHSPADVIGKSGAIFYTEEQIAEGRPQWVLDQAAKRGSYTDEGWRVRKDGSRFWANTVTTAIRASDGSLLGFAKITRDESESQRYQATHDRLTGLPNFEAVDGLLRGLDPELLAVMYCDIDRFKRINDSLGHDAGDELLVMMARRLTAALPEDWLVMRPSGDEFIVICPDVPAAGGLRAAVTMVSSALQASVPLRGNLVQVSASIGVATPKHAGSSGSDLVRFASAAVVEARRGRSAERISFAGPGLIESTDGQVRLEGQLRQAIDSDDLVLHYQPIVTRTGAIRSVEALVRWPHPDKGMIPPDQFLPVAKRGGLLRDLDLWVLSTALAEAASWPDRGSEPVKIGVNLAELTPSDPAFVDLIAGVVEASGVAWNRVVLELVETTLVDLPPRAVDAMHELVRRGAEFAVDDFGTGYSSLARLKNFPPQVIKVDREFVSGIETSSSEFALVQAVVDMAHAMGCRCVAEGVETTSQFRMLRDIKVDGYQGWLFSRAVPPAELHDLFAAPTLLTSRDEDPLLAERE